MKKYALILFIVTSLLSSAQDTTISNIDTLPQKPVKIFHSERTINANTTEPIGKGKMDFKVTHNFEDIAGDNGGIKRFFGLDNNTDVRIGFHIGLTDRLDFIFARAKGNGSVPTKIRTTQLYEFALKYQIFRQMENDPANPLSMSLFISNVISAMSSSYNPPRDMNGNTTDTALNHGFTFKDFGDRNSQVYQLIIAKKIGKLSIQLNPTLVHRNYVAMHDQKSIFALGGAARIPVTKSVHFIIDYFHSFRSQSSEDYFNSVDNTFNPPNDIDKNPSAFKLYNPLGIGVEILTAGHVFHLNFTNATEVLESRIIPGTTRTWSKGGYRWAFTISRSFVLWRDKSATVNW